MPELGLNLDKVCFLIMKARQFDVPQDVIEDDDDADDGSNAIDEDFEGEIEGSSEDPAFEEIKSLIDDMDEDEQAELVALVWVGRGDFDPEDWDGAVQTARERHTGPTSTYLLGIPILADYLDEGLAAFDLSCVDTSPDDFVSRADQ